MLLLIVQCGSQATARADTGLVRTASPDEGGMRNSTCLADPSEVSQGHRSSDRWCLSLMSLGTSEGHPPARVNVIWSDDDLHFPIRANYRLEALSNPRRKLLQGILGSFSPFP